MKKVPIIRQTGFGGLGGFPDPVDAPPAGEACASGPAMVVLAAMAVAALLARPKVSQLTIGKSGIKSEQPPPPNLSPDTATVGIKQYHHKHRFAPCS